MLNLRDTIFPLAVLWSILIFVGCSSSSVNLNHMGAFITEDQRLISIRKSADNTLRYRIFQSGESGRLYPINDSTYISGQGFSSKEPENLRLKYNYNSPENQFNIEWMEKGKTSQIAHATHKEEWISIRSGNITLNGRMSLPKGAGPFPAIVLVHGSGDDKATDYYHNGDFFAAHGIATLTFDKRGTGDSEGAYTFDYHKLAGDVVAAVESLSTRLDINQDQIGLSGYSQGGWVAPLAASMSEKISYVVINFGMIESAKEEARLETRNTLRAKGVKEKYLSEVDELTLATVDVVASGFKSGWGKVDELDKKYKKATWRKMLKGTTVGKFLKYPKWLIKMIGPGQSPSELDWDYESTPILDSLNIPITWLLPESDTEAPNELTILKVQAYQNQGKPFDLQIFPNTDHRMLVFEEKNGERIYTKYSADYFRAEVESVYNMIKIGQEEN